MGDDSLTTLDAHLRRKRLTNKQISLICGVSLDTVQTWRNGTHRPRLRCALVLAKRLRIGLEVLRPDLFPKTEPLTPLDAFMRAKLMQNVDLAALIGVTQQAVSLWRRGERPPSAVYAKKIEAGLGIHRHLLRPDLWDAPPSRKRAARSHRSPPEKTPTTSERAAA